MLEKLKAAEDRYEEISLRLTDPSVVNDNSQYRSLMKEYKDLTPLVTKYRELAAAQQAHEEAKELLSESGLDHELREMAEEQLRESQKEIELHTGELRILLLPRDPNDDKSVIVEIRGRRGRRGSGAVCRLAAPHVYHVCRAPRLGARPHFRQRNRAGGL